MTTTSFDGGQRGVESTVDPIAARFDLELEEQAFPQPL